MTVIFGIAVYGVSKLMRTDFAPAWIVALPPISLSSNVTRPWNVTVDWNITDFMNVATSANVVATCIMRELIVPMMASRTD